MKIKSSNTGKMVLEHTTRDGATMDLDVSVDNVSRKWIKDNIGNISYDVTNDILKFKTEASNTTVARALVENNGGEVPAGRQVLYNDGDKYNLRMKNLVSYE